MAPITIGNLVSKLARAGYRTNSSTIRFYIQKGLLPEPTKRSATWFDYDERHFYGMIVIMTLRKLDISLRATRILLENFDDETVKRLAMKLKETYKGGE